MDFHEIRKDLPMEFCKMGLDPISELSILRNSMGKRLRIPKSRLVLLGCGAGRYGHTGGWDMRYFALRSSLSALGVVGAMVVA